MESEQALLYQIAASTGHACTLQGIIPPPPPNSSTYDTIETESINSLATGKWVVESSKRDLGPLLVFWDWYLLIGRHILPCNNTVTSHMSDPKPLIVVHSSKARINDDVKQQLSYLHEASPYFSVTILFHNAGLSPQTTDYNKLMIKLQQTS